ncbi:hypothetical protein A6A04_20490, partial [Paramagnetospirillum marisnigri]
MSTSPQADDVVSTDRPTIRVFISSPSDVRPERLISERVVQRLDREFSYHFRIEAMLWEREPLVAGEHFQDRIVPPHETDIVVVILWSRLGMTLPEDKYRGALSGGAVTGTEWEFEDALASYRELRLPDLLLYRKKTEITGSLEDEAAVQERLGQKRQVEEFMTRWTRSADGSAFTAASWEFADAAAFEEQLENHLRELIRRRLTSAEQGPAGIRWHQGSPFRGLQSFDLDHAPVFFGRTRARNEVRELLARQAERGSAFVLVMGASGSGKSSLVKAGVLADLKLSGMIGRVALCRHAILRPADGEGDLIGGLAAALLAPEALPELARLQYDVASLADQLRDNPKQAVFAVRQGLAAAGEAAKLTEIAEARLLVVVDQLEELFTLDTITPAEREGFVAALAALARSGLVWVIATLRSDLFDRLETVPALAELSAGEARYLLTAPTDGELGQIITRPAREAGLRFEADAASGTSLDDVLREAAGCDPNALPLLSYVLDLLWQRRRPEDGVLTFAAYEELGGLNGAIGRRAEDVFTALPEDVQAAFPQVLRALVTVGQGAKGQATARMAARADFPPNTPAGALVTALLGEQARLLVADDARLRVAHEAVLTHWDRAREQIAEDRSDLQLRARLEQAAVLWQGASDADRPSLLLHPGLPLSEAEDLLQRRHGELDAVVVDYVTTSGITARAVEKRRLNRLRVVAVVFAVLALAAGAFGWMALEQKREARLQESKAVAARAEAEGLIRYMQYDLRDKLAPVGRLDLLDGVNQRAKAYFDRFPPTATDWDALRDQAAGQINSGDILVGQGDLAGALAEFRQSLAIFERLAAHDPANTEWQSDLSISHVKVGGILQAQGDLAGALVEFRKGLDIAERLAAHDPANAQWQRDLSVSYGNVGGILQAQGDLAGALVEFRKGLDIAERLAAHDPANAQWQRDLSVSYNNVGGILQAQGDVTGALALNRKSLAIRERLAARAPANTQWQLDLSVSYNNVGFILKYQGDLAGALALNRQSLAIRERLVAHDPANAQWKSDLGDAHNSLGWTLILQGNFVEGRMETGAALSLVPDSLASMVNHGHTYLLTGDGATARSWYLKALPKIANEAELKSTIIDDFDIFIGKGWKVAECRQMKDWVVAE